VDHGSGFLHVEHHFGFSAVETIRAKQAYEKMSLDSGVIIQSYLTDSGEFKVKAFVDQIRNSGQPTSESTIAARTLIIRMASPNVQFGPSPIWRVPSSSITLHIGRRELTARHCGQWPFLTLSTFITTPPTLKEFFPPTSSQTWFPVIAALCIFSIQVFNRARDFHVDNPDLVLESAWASAPFIPARCLWSSSTQHDNRVDYLTIPRCVR
jgi:hypothetical protein